MPPCDKEIQPLKIKPGDSVFDDDDVVLEEKSVLEIYNDKRHSNLFIVFMEPYT